MWIMTKVKDLPPGVDVGVYGDCVGWVGVEGWDVPIMEPLRNFYRYWTGFGAIMAHTTSSKLYIEGCAPQPRAGYSHTGATAAKYVPGGFPLTYIGETHTCRPSTW